MNIEERTRDTRGFLLLIFISSFLFIFELAGGYIAWSATVLMDAWHVIGDTLVYYLSLRALRDHMEDRERYRRAICNSTIVALIAGVNIALSVFRTVLFPTEHTDPSLMFWVSLTGLGINFVMLGILFYYRLGHTHSHGHTEHAWDHNHDEHEHPHHKTPESFIKRVAILHTLGDILISVFGVGTAVFILQTGGHPTYIDMGASVVAGLLVIFFALRARQEAQRELSIQL